MSRRGQVAAFGLAMGLLLAGRPGAHAQDAGPAPAQAVETSAEVPAEQAADGHTDQSTDTGPATRGYSDLRRITPITGDVARGQAEAGICVACHGPDGISTIPIYPNLAGQHPDYMFWQLVKFKLGGDEFPVMAAIVSELSEQDMKDLSVYYAGLDPAGGPGTIEAEAEAEADPGDVAAAGAEAGADAGGDAEPAEAAPDPALLALGRRLYLSGDPPKGIPPCQGCHGREARGHPLALEPDAAGYTPYAVYPSLRGQVEHHLQTRLGEYRDGKHRYSTTGFVMGDVGHRLDDASISALSAWLSRLPK